MQVDRLMTPDPVTVAPGDVADDALQLMDDEDVRHLPVVDDGRLVGVVSDRDLLGVVGWVPSRPRRGEQDAARVRDVMQRAVTAIRPDTPVRHALSAFVRLGIGCLPVLEGERLVGILSEMDILVAFRRGRREGHIGAALDPPLETLMSDDVVTVEPTATLEQAADVAHRARTRHLVVVDEARRPAGVVSDRDLRAAAGAGHPLQDAVAGIMSRPPLTGKPDTLATDAAGELVENRFSALPVVDAEGRLTGIVTVTDLLAHCLAPVASDH